MSSIRGGGEVEGRGTLPTEVEDEDESESDDIKEMMRSVQEIWWIFLV